MADSCGKNSELEMECKQGINAEVTIESRPVRDTKEVLGTRLSERYKDHFFVGTCIRADHLMNPKLVDLVLEQFNSLTCENDMKPEAMLQQAQCIEQDAVVVALTPNAKRILDWARDNEFIVRGHTLVWFNQTPDWFFRKGFTWDGEYVDRETMLARMESYIRQTLACCEEAYPGLIYAWDVANEVFDDDGKIMRECPWLSIVGEDYPRYAFLYARKYAPAGVKLFYNDFNTYMPEKLTKICNMVEKLKEEGLIDGIGMQSHLATHFPKAKLYLSALETVAKLGLEVQVTELDITTEKTPEGWATQAQRYREIFDSLSDKEYVKANNVTCMTIWGVADCLSWRDYGDPLLFDNEFKPKESYYSVLHQETK